jgi:hypothetical protein
VASKDKYEDQIWLSASTEEVFDLVCDLQRGWRVILSPWSVKPSGA